MIHNKIIVITGPTASGKSKLAESLYNEIPSVILNADALQVYDELPILTAKPSDFKNAKKFRLYNALSFKEECSVARWLGMAELEIKEAWAKDITPVIVGGTGFYIRALLYGLSEVPALDPKVMESVEEEFEEIGRREFFSMLCARDSKVKNKIHERDTYRLLRAAGVLKQTGRSIYDYLEKDSDLRYKDCLHIFLDPERDVLYQWCNDRFSQMLDMGVIDEVKNFIGVKESNKSYAVEKAIGYKELEMFLNGEISLQEAAEIIRRLTRNYAKRQCTWFRNQISDKHLVQYNNYSTIEPKILDMILGFVGA